MLMVGLEVVLARWQWHGGLSALELQLALFSELWQNSMALILLKLLQKSVLSLVLLALFVMSSGSTLSHDHALSYKMSVKKMAQYHSKIN
jgi:hypothetical protein